MASSDGRNPNVQSNLHQQDLSKLDITKLSALSPEVISRQATINIGTIGHVAHGKSTVVKAISGVQTVRFKNELERNITIKLERVSESLIRMYRERSDIQYEHMFFEKQKRYKKRPMSPEPEKSSPPSKKYKKSTVEEYVVDKILNFKCLSGTEYFHVKWKGWPDSENTWEPLDNLDNCAGILTQYVNLQEQKYYDKIDSIKKEISFGDLFSDDNMLKRLKDIEDVDIILLKQKLIFKLLSILTLEESQEYHATTLIVEARNVLQLYTLARKRIQQLIALRDWEDHINQVDKSKRINVVNVVDLVGPPNNFTYINQTIPGQGVTIPDEPPIGCQCQACNCRSKGCCGTQGGNLFAYTVTKRLRLAAGIPIYECNKACRCPPDCNNRVVQGGRNVKLCIFRTPNGCGWGVRTEQKIRQGQFICQYIGEVITFEEAEKRGREYDANGLTYLFDLDFNSVENPYTVDAAYLGNISHFINHSCDPNLGVWVVWADCLDPNLPMLALFATRDIEAGEEICFDYLQKTGDCESTGPVSESPTPGPSAAGVPAEPDTPPSPEAPLSPAKSRVQGKLHKNLTQCKCGAINCRKYLF